MSFVASYFLLPQQPMIGDWYSFWQDKVTSETNIMRIQKIVVTALFSLFAAPVVLAQDVAVSCSTPSKQTAPQFLDSIKKTFVTDKMASCVDSLWLKELTSLDLYADLSADIKNIDLDEKVEYNLSTELLKKRLKELDAKSPFNIEYNPGLENLIKSWLKNRKRAFERLMAVSEYYFPLFEEALARKNVPLEIKYLAVVESALNPKAVSRVGATGLWQFMYQTGKQYNLHIDSYVDERSDPLKASDAAAQYMSNMYRIFGDWDLVLASYNSGPGNVAKAIRRSGGQENYWNIRRNLPKETQGYVPAFLATMYIYEYHKEHGIVPNRAIIKHFQTDTVGIRKQISFKQLSDLLDIPIAQLQLLNPSYKVNVIPTYTDKMHYLRLPAEKVALFTSNEDKIYAYVEFENARRERPYQQYLTARDSSRVAARDSMPKDVSTKTKYHKVRRGENLSSIANRYDVSVAQLKKWNKLRSNTAPLGRNLRIYKTVAAEENTAVADASNNEKEAKTQVSGSQKVNDTAVSENSEPQLYTVQAGDNLSSIARRFNVTVADLKQWNNMADNNVKLNTQLKILTAETAEELRENAVATQEIAYVVVAGDNLAAIARKHQVSVADIQKWNNLSGTQIAVGAKLIIQKTDFGAKSEVAANKQKSRSESYLVRKGDSLSAIAKKYPGVTVSDIKKWNKISGDDLKPGMRLKINGK